MEFLTDTLIARIESELEDTSMRQRMVDDLMRFVSQGEDDPQNLWSYLLYLEVNDDEFSNEDYDQMSQAQNILKDMLDDTKGQDLI